MKNPSKLWMTVIIVVMSAAIVLSLKQGRKPSEAGSVNLTLARMKGEVDAPVTVTEYVDFQCPACAAGSNFLNEYMKNFPGRIRLDIRYFPLAMHKHGLLSVQYAECAARQGKFWPYHDALFSRQSNWKKLADAKPAFNQMAHDVQLDVKQLAVCLEDPTIDAFIKKTKKEGKSLGIRSTPAYLINDKLVVGQKNLAVELDRLLKGQSQ